MLLQTNSYIVPREKQEEHARLMRRFKQTLQKLGCDQFEIYEQTGPGWAQGESGRCVQLMRFRDRKHQQHVQMAERTDAAAQAIIVELSELLNIPVQQQQGFFAAGFYQSILQERPEQEPVANPASPPMPTPVAPAATGEPTQKPAEPDKPQPGVF